MASNGLPYQLYKNKGMSYLNNGSRQRKAAKGAQLIVPEEGPLQQVEAELKAHQQHYDDNWLRMPFSEASKWHDKKQELLQKRAQLQAAVNDALGVTAQPEKVVEAEQKPKAVKRHSESCAPKKAKKKKLPF